MQDNSVTPETSNLDRNVISYRPERPGLEFRREATGETDSAPVTQQSRTTYPVTENIVAAPEVTLAKKPFTLGQALLVLGGVMIIGTAGYVAYITWFAQ
jgi:hypothetical protein